MRAASTSAAGTLSGTSSATSWVATGYGDITGASTGPSAAAAVSITDRSSSMAAVLGGRPKAAMTRGCSSPAYPASQSCPSSAWTNSAAQRPGCHGAVWSARIRNGTRLSRRTWRAASTASSQHAGRPSPHQPSRSRSPATTAAMCSG